MALRRASANFLQTPDMYVNKGRTYVLKWVCASIKRAYTSLKITYLIEVMTFSLDSWMDVYYWEEDSTVWATGSPILKPNYTPSSAIIDPTRVTRLSWSPRNRDIVEKIDNMIAAWTLIPKENGKPMILERYEKGEGYVPLYHYDDDSVQSYLIATVIIYLSNIHHGGETIFPNLKLKRRGDEDSWSECARQGSTLEADKGDALLIFNLHPNCTLNENSLYGSCPVTDGQKWDVGFGLSTTLYEGDI
ncbi:hypothetical protein QJS10_CPA10g00400 [Acorus calamus]|uniref:Prolyl 4-hydroxylase alpha subunit domain-containing protein n=1 Tax=Acorus calamus TaxID=4465 RepID=A0AAV9DZ07_ACOCL|nr:hypothetical protein QJS10_CPA10g00400 [Acorus calamus]